MAKSLDLQFITENGKTTTISIENPIEPVNTAVVKQAMDQMIAANIFATNNGNLTAVKGAKLIDRTVTDYELV
ncbi:DUF2922 domain-containing protein [Bacillus sp. 03113]|uniref:DUF2922 domain-containing protein n=1 Tax=Bacillus sp. 03113 TaxID=2578211 RepID=UPI001141E31D|nr:DUF2922 domain-containing protein [Bacillus sp. 03113]